MNISRSQWQIIANRCYACAWPFVILLMIILTIAAIVRDNVPLFVLMLSCVLRWEHLKRFIKRDMQNYFESKAKGVKL